MSGSQGLIKQTCLQSICALLGPTIQIWAWHPSLNMKWKDCKLQKLCSTVVNAFLSPGPNTQDQKACRQVTLGHGGTFKLGESRPEYVGFSEGDIGVGVFFMADDNRCFAANIEITYEAQQGPNGHAPAMSIDKRWQRSHAVVADNIRKLLDAESKGSNWGPKTNRMRQTLVIVGRGARREPDTTTNYVRWAVSDAVQEWLEVPELERKEPEQYGGLVVKLSLSVRKWKLEDVQANAGVWRFTVVR
ncbi:hypothetical protein LTR85_010830 [Meristemomyces frigidus]|nr:hypothetical protein LTR85_010830 [Meristemomyces frigidus]